MLDGISPQEIALLAAALIIAGAATGVLAGLFGVGGGTIIVPVLYEVFRLIGVDESVRMHLCVGTSLAIIIPTSIRSFRGHLKKDVVDIPTLRLWAIPIVVGVVAGSFIAAVVSGDVLKVVFALCLVIGGIKMLFGGDRWHIAKDLPGKIVMRLFGVMIGVLATLMGIGGGLFGNLLMTLHNRPIHQAVATSAGVGVLVSIPAAVGYIAAGWPHMAQLPPASVGYVSAIGFALVAPLSVLTAPIGVRLAHQFSRRRLEATFGVYQLLIATRFLWAAAA